MWNAGSFFEVWKVTVVNAAVEACVVVLGGVVAFVEAVGVRVCANTFLYYGCVAMGADGAMVRLV